MVRDRPDRQSLSQLRTDALVREARQLAGLSQSELAARIGTSQSVVSRWERGVDTPRIDTLAGILQACGFEADLTFRRHDDVDRAQLHQNLAMTASQRLRSVANVSEFLAKAHPVEREAARA